MYGGYQYKTTGTVEYSDIQGVFTSKVVNWLGDFNGYLQAESLYTKLDGPFYGFEDWEAEDETVGPESIYQDLVMFFSFGEFSLGVEDTICFVKFLSSEYQGGLAGLQGSIDQAFEFTNFYVCCDVWGIPGDANLDGKVNILDIVYVINYKYKGQNGVMWPETVDYPSGNHCDYLMNVNDHVMHDGKIGDILDIVYLINYKYKSGPEPTCPQTFR
jgi:hypothetical protein